ncbi:hypothetical protein FBUS_06539 [Fasciolopsis buskii]|uniref:Uncharacterized protein n=1 Tax=Fasciolopsis buskii TaxID=27845 RepID=A0A8E0RV42_9TREM|nr:hypothetical protein FBUS_06539 [Fasciolopsis buski]
MGGIRGWFGKRFASPVDSSIGRNTSNRPSLLSSGSEYSRRTSISVSQLANRSAAPEKPDCTEPDTYGAGQTRNMLSSFCRRLSILSNGTAPKSPREFCTHANTNANNTRIR